MARTIDNIVNEFLLLHPEIDGSREEIQDWFETAKAEGYTEGYDDGYDSGYDSGYDNGTYNYRDW